MKKALTIVFIVVISLVGLLLCAYFLLSFLYSEETSYPKPYPTDQPNTTWVCEEYQASFSVNEDEDVENGIIIIDGAERKFDLRFPPFDDNCYMRIYDENGEGYLQLTGDWSCGDDVFFLEIEDTKGFWGQKSVLMIFKRI